MHPASLYRVAPLTLSEEMRAKAPICAIRLSSPCGPARSWRNSLDGFELFRVDWQFAEALAGSRKYCVDHGGHDGRSPRLAHPARRLGTLDNVNLDGRRLVHAQDLVAIEVGLLDTAVLQRDLAIERCRDAEDDRALDLCPDGIGIDDGAAIDRADDASDTNRSVPRHLDLSDLRHIGREGELNGDATADPFRQRLSPAGLLRGMLEDGFGAGRLIEKGEPIGD